MHTPFLGFRTAIVKLHSKNLADTSIWEWHFPCSISVNKQHLSCGRYKLVSPETNNNMSKNILVVDDDPGTLKFVSHFLRKEGYEITEANDGAEAINLIDNSQFDLVLSDIRMPRVDGVALATNILSRVPTIPIILMTAVPFELTRSLGYNVPCLSKPILLDELRTSVQTALARRETLSGA